MKSPRFVFLVAVVMAAALSRIMAHPWNATPIAAIALFAGAHFTDKRAAYLVPLLAMVISDAVIGFYSTVAVTYVSFALTVFIGTRLRFNKSVARVGGAAVAASLLFFVVTNLVCWLTMAEYTKDGSGLALCFVRAVPFYRNMLAGDLLFTGLLFGGFALSEKVFPRLREVPQAA